jgi:pyruvate-ferredoxin/flavodoxin oxidoreductase
VTSFRPFPAARLAAVLQKARAVAVIERTDEPAAADNPLTREVKAALADLASDGVSIPRVLSVTAGLGSRDVAAGDIAAVYKWLAEPVGPARRFAVLGVRHQLGLERIPLEIRPKGAYSMRGHSIGGFGSVTTNKLLAALAGDVFGLHVQAYPRYGSEKKGLPTTYFLTMAEAPIRTHAELELVDFVPLHDVAAFAQGDPLHGLVEGGTLFLQTALTEPNAIWRSIPIDARTKILQRGIKVMALDTAALARRHSPRPDLLVRMQGIALVGVFFRVTPFAKRAGLDRERLLTEVRGRLGRFFGKRGAKVVDANLDVIREAYDSVIDVTAALAPMGEDKSVEVLA